MKFKKTLCLTLVAIGLSGCSSIENMKGVKLLKSSFSAYDRKAELFDIGETKAFHKAEGVVGNSLTIITPKHSQLAEHLILGNRTYIYSDAAERRQRFTYITTATPAKHKDAGLFSYTKTRCRKQSNDPILFSGQYISDQTHCLMKKGDTFPVGGLVVTYEGTYSVTKGKNTDTHKIEMKKAESEHILGSNIWQKVIISDIDEMATENDFYSLFTRYVDDKLTFKFSEYTPQELKSAISRQARALSKSEQVYVKQINRLSKGDALSFGYGYSLKGNDPMDGIITFKYSSEPYKNNGSILQIQPTYYPTAREAGKGANITIDFARQRQKIIAMIERIKND